MIPLSHNHITSNYGMRRHPIKKKRCFHCGIDLQGHKSTPIYSSAEGKVRKIGRTKTYGNFIEIEHSNKFRTKYAHLNKIFVQDGEKILRGQKIGLQGKTGNATGEHLHYEIWLNNKHIDPFDFIVHACKN